MRWTSRKFWSMWVFAWLFRDMRVDNYITGDQFVAVITILLIAFFGTNAAGKFADKWKGGA